MPDREKTPEKGAEKAEGGAPPRKKPPILVLGGIVGLMVVEGAALFFILGSSGKQPATAEAGLHEPENAHAEALQEIPLIADEFQNMQTGRVWIWKLEVFLKVKGKNVEHVQHELETRAAEVKAGVQEIMRRAQHNQLKEPGLETLTRQLTAFVNRVFGADADGANRVEGIIIAKCLGIQADF